MLQQSVTFWLALDNNITVLGLENNHKKNPFILQICHTVTDIFTLSVALTTTTGHTFFECNYWSQLPA